MPEPAAVVLKRIAYRTDGVFGVLLLRGRPICVTCEDPWKNNAVGESCIPEGRYEVRPWNSKKYPGTWRLKDVPGRSDILIHWGNTQKDTRGCILVGLSFTMFGDQQGVASSRAAVDMLRRVLDDNFTLEIRNAL